MTNDIPTKTFFEYKAVLVVKAMLKVMKQDI